MADTHPSPPVQRALGVTELLENVLQNLRMGDILYNAQRVSKFWNECIKSSLAIRKKCFLVAEVLADKEEYDELLFVKPDGPPPNRDQLSTRMSVRALYSQLGDKPISSASCRKTLVNDIASRRSWDHYELKMYLLETEISSTDDKTYRNSLYTSNTGTKAFDGFSFFDQSRLNPFLRQCLSLQHHFPWTGYQDHVVVFLGVSRYWDGNRLKRIQHDSFATLEAQQHVSTWKDALIAQPAITKLSLYSQDKHGQKTETFSITQSDGVTIYDFFHLFATFCVQTGSAIPITKRWLEH